jgi:predicted Zn-dependent protease
MQHNNFLKWLSFCLTVILLLSAVPHSVAAQVEAPNDTGLGLLYLPSITNTGGNVILSVEGTVEQVESTYQDGLIVSQATLRIERVLSGNVEAEQVVIRYLGGTVGDTTLLVTHEPILQEGMRVNAILHRLDSGEYEIWEVETDLAILSAGVYPNFVLNEPWADANVPLLMQINPNTADVAGTGEQQAVINAINTWNAVSGSYFLFRNTGSACTQVANDETNCVMWLPGPNSNALAATFSWVVNNRRVETDIAFYEADTDGPIQWDTTPGSTEFDVESVALHELGHSLGLGHSSSGTVMAPSIAPGTTVRILSNDDMGGVRSLYTLTDAYVDRNASANGICTASRRCNTVARGTAKVAGNKSVRITAGSYPEAITINRPMTLVSEGGMVTIGQ